MRERARKVSPLASTNNMEIKIRMQTLEDMAMNPMATTKVRTMDLTKDSSKQNGSSTRILKRHPYKALTQTQTLLLPSKDPPPTRPKQDYTKPHQQQIVQNFQIRVRVSFVDRATAVASCPLTIYTRPRTSWIHSGPTEWFPIQTSISGRLKSFALSVASLTMKRQSRK